MTSRAIWGSNSSSGRHLRSLPSSESEALAATAAAAASEVEESSSSGNFAFTCSHVASLPGALGSSRRLRAATATPPGWRHADDALLNFASSVASRGGGGAAAGVASYERARPPIVRLITPCLGVCALMYASARGVHTHKVNESLNTAHSRSINSTTINRSSSSSRQSQQQQQHAAAAARQRGRPATSERASYRLSEDFVP